MNHQIGNKAESLSLFLRSLSPWFITCYLGLSRHRRTSKIPQYAMWTITMMISIIDSLYLSSDQLLARGDEAMVKSLQDLKANSNHAYIDMPTDRWSTLLPAILHSQGYKQTWEDDEVTESRTMKVSNTQVLTTPT